MTGLLIGLLVSQLFAKTYGGANIDRTPAVVVQTSDGGYALLGDSYSFGSGERDLLLLKLSPSGDLEWARTFGEANIDEPFSMVQTTDGGYALAGVSWSYGAGNADALILRLNPSGGLTWARTFGGATNLDDACSIIQTSDGGFAVAGGTESFGAGGRDFFVLKLDNTGSLTWAKTFGGAESEEARSIVQTPDGGYAIAGSTGNVQDILVLRLDASGNLTWARVLGGASQDLAYAIVQTTDGGYAVAGCTYSLAQVRMISWSSSWMPLEAFSGQRPLEE